MKFIRAVLPFVCYAGAVFTAMEMTAAADSFPQTWLLVSFPLLVLAYSEAARAVGFSIKTARVVGFVLLGALGRCSSLFLLLLVVGNTRTSRIIDSTTAWILVEVFVLAGLLGDNIRRLGAWVLVAMVALGAEWLLSWLLFGGDLVSPELALSVVEVQSMRGRFRVLSVVLLSADLVRNVGLFGLAYWWRDRAEVAKA